MGSKKMGRKKEQLNNSIQKTLLIWGCIEAIVLLLVICCFKAVFTSKGTTVFFIFFSIISFITIFIICNVVRLENDENELKNEKRNFQKIEILELMNSSRKVYVCPLYFNAYRSFFKKMISLNEIEFIAEMREVSKVNIIACISERYIPFEDISVDDFIETYQILDVQN